MKFLFAHARNRVTKIEDRRDDKAKGWKKKEREKKRIVKKKFYSLLGLIGFNWVPSNSNCLRLTFQTGRSVQYHIRCMVPNLTPEPEKLEIFVGVSKFAAVSIMRERGKRKRRGKKREENRTKRGMELREEHLFQGWRIGSAEGKKGRKTVKNLALRLLWSLIRCH